MADRIIMFTGGVEIAGLRLADVAINCFGVVVKDRYGTESRVATEDELEVAEVYDPDVHGYWRIGVGDVFHHEDGSTR